MTTQVISGMIVRYYHDKGYGFAETRDVGEKIETVFFHSKDARQVADDDGELILIDLKDSEADPRALRNNPQWIIMEVHQTSKGWRADKWGHRPGPNWIYDFIKAGTIDQFVGGQIEEVYIDKDGEVIEGFLRRGALMSATLRPSGVSMVVRQEVDGQMCDMHRGHALSRATHKFVSNGKLAITIHYAPSDTYREAARLVTLTMPGFE